MSAPVVAAAGAPLALWGGFECSVIRVREYWRDQVHETGHHRRAADLDLAETLGLRALRYPLVWERVVQDEDGGDLPWHDARIRTLSEMGVGIVGGLLHHGSGPAGTDLLAPDFSALLAEHAGRMARRYPQISAWTPVNEPLTTARFSCLYGFWYPHLRDEGAFLRAIAAQCRGVLLSMRSIRAVDPGALLLQTEDLSRTFATPALAEQARYENQRRWLSLDLLCGRLDARHPWYRAFREAGVSARYLDELAGGEATPDVIGANYYVTSERFLDHRTALYPARLHGSNGRATYADTEAVRIDLPDGLTGWLPRLREVWQRYRLPVVIGEAHLGCEDEAEQARWFAEAWDAAHALRQEGADIRAVTAWALAGSVDWSSLVRERRNHFEAGVWEGGDARRPRLLMHMLEALGHGEPYDHACLREPGWWRGEARYHAAARRAGRGALARGPVAR